MSTDLAILDAGQMQAAVDYAERLAYSGLIPDVYQGKPANVLWAIEFGRTLGLSTLAAINGVNVIKGKPTASAALISALVRRAGHKMRIGYDTASMVGWAEIVRADDPDFTFRSEWNLDRAVEAELCKIKDGKPYAVDSKGNTLPWKKFYPSMVKARATTEVARDACEEVLFGLHYTPEELGAEVDEDGTPVPVRQMPERPTERSRPQPQQADEWTQPAPSQDIDDAEIVPDTEPAESEAYVKARMTYLHTLIAKKYGPKTDDERHASFSRFCQRPIGSAKEMTPQEREAFIAVLEKQPDQPAPSKEQLSVDVSDASPAAIAEAEKLAAHAEPPQIAEEDRLRDRVESAGDPTMLEQAMQTVFDADAAGAIDRAAFGRLQSAGTARGKKLKELAAAATQRRANQKAAA